MDFSARRVVRPDTVNYIHPATLVQGNVKVDVKMDGLVLIVVLLVGPSQVNKLAPF